MIENVKKYGASATLAAVVIGLWSGIASADPPDDPTGGGTTQLTTGITEWVEAYGVPMLVTLLVLGVVIALFIKFGKKAKGTV